MTLSKFCYFILPPIVFRLISQIKKKLRRQGDLKTNQVKMNLNELRDKGFNYFFDNELISEFCDHLERDSAVNQSVATRNEKNRKYLDELISKGYSVIRGEFSVETINKWHDDLKKKMDGASKRCDELVGAYGLASMKNIQENYLGNKTNFELVSGIVRLWDAHITYPELASFHQNATILDVVGSYFGGNINESSVYVEYKNRVKDTLINSLIEG